MESNDSNKKIVPIRARDIGPAQGSEVDIFNVEMQQLAFDLEDALATNISKRKSTIGRVRALLSLKRSAKAIMKAENEKLSSLVSKLRLQLWTLMLSLGVVTAFLATLIAK